MIPTQRTRAVTWPANSVDPDVKNGSNVKHSSEKSKVLGRGFLTIVSLSPVS